MIEPPASLDVVDYIQKTRDSYASLGYPDYNWAHNADAPILNPPVQLAESRVAVVASGGIYVEGQVAFHHKDDTSHRQIPMDVDVNDLRISHFAYDTTDAKADPNVVLPIGALRSLAADGTIGSLAPVGLTFMGGIYSQRRVREDLIPALTEELRELAPDVVLLVPV
jgi:D-proline reductase (dithiol) PrdB